MSLDDVIKTYKHLQEIGHNSEDSLNIYNKTALRYVNKHNKSLVDTYHSNPQNINKWYDKEEKTIYRYIRMYGGNLK